jgi:hypothetical protein
MDLAYHYGLRLRRAEMSDVAQTKEGKTEDKRNLIIVSVAIAAIAIWFLSSSGGVPEVEVADPLPIWVEVGKCSNKNGFIKCVVKNKTDVALPLYESRVRTACYNDKGTKVDERRLTGTIDPNGSSEESLCFFQSHTPGKIVLFK